MVFLLEWWFSIVFLLKMVMLASTKCYRQWATDLRETSCSAGAITVNLGCQKSVSTQCVFRVWIGIYFHILNICLSCSCVTAIEAIRSNPSLIHGRSLWIAVLWRLQAAKKKMAALKVSFSCNLVESTSKSILKSMCINTYIRMCL